MFRSAADNSSSAAASFCVACRHASALPSRARTISARSCGSRARWLAKTAVRASRSGGGGACACKAESCLSNSRSAESFACKRASTLASSRSQIAAAFFASSRCCRTGFFSPSNLLIASFWARAFSARSASICLTATSICAMRNATSFCSCSSFLSATISLRTSGKLAACAVPSRPR